LSQSDRRGANPPCTGWRKQLGKSSRKRWL